MTIRSVSQDITPATRLTDTLFYDPKKRVAFVNYFQNNSSGKERKDTLDKIVEILHQDEAKLNDFFTVLDDILRQGLITQANDGPIPSTQIHYDPIQDIVEALYNAEINTFNLVSSLARTEWSQRLLDFLYRKANEDSRGFMFVFNQPNSEKVSTQ